MRRLVHLLAACVLAMSGVLPAFAQEREQTILHLLDYVGADYGGAVENGRIKSADEYKEMIEFSGQALGGIKALADNPAKTALTPKAESLSKLVADKAAAATVADAAAKLRWAVIGAYKLRVAP